VGDNEIVYGNIGHGDVGYGTPVLWVCRLESQVVSG
jgi:hypothetical protein